jgi:ATP-dependent Clp protease, protease subunit
MAEETEEKNQKNSDEKPVDLLVRTLKTRRVLLSEDVNSKSARKIIDQLFLLEQDDPDSPIYFFINSPGGEVTSGMAIYDVMEFLKPKIYTIGCGLVASIAAIIHLQPEKDARLSLPNAEFLLHQPLGGMQGSASDLEIHANHILRTRTQLNDLISNKSGQSLDEVEKSTKRDFWMTARQALEWGLVGNIIARAEDLPGKE